MNNNGSSDATGAKKGVLFAIPLYICPHCEFTISVNPIDRIESGGTVKAIMAEGRCQCSVWNVMLPAVPAVRRETSPLPTIEIPSCHQ